MTKVGFLNFVADSIFAALLLNILPFTSVTFQSRLFVAYILLQIFCGRYKKIMLLATDELKLNILSHIYFYFFGFLIIWTYAKSDIFLLLFYDFLCFVFSMWFAIFTRHKLRKYFKHNVLVFGIGTSAEQFRQTVLKNSFSMFQISAFVNCNDLNYFENIHQYKKVQSNKIINFNQIDEVLNKGKTDIAIIAISQFNRKDIQTIMTKVQDQVENVYFTPRFGNLVTFDSKVEDYDGQLLIANSIGSIDIGGKILKRALDICFGIAGCLLLIPLTIFVKIINLKAGDKGPVFFTQERIGKGGKLFKIYKYRTMLIGADQILEKLMKENLEVREEYEKNKKLENDPRITKAGKFLREKSIDEFPQFINVLKGEMTVVGPRPYLPREKEDMGDFYGAIIKMKPGLSGMWQTHGRSDTDFDQRLVYDNYYSHNWNMWLDIVIIYRTISLVLRGKGAK